MTLSLSEVTVENSETNDGFSVNLLSGVNKSTEGGLALINVSGSVVTLYGAFPKHYRDFLENEKHKDFIYSSLLGNATVTTITILGFSYSRIVSIGKVQEEDGDLNLKLKEGV